MDFFLSQITYWANNFAPRGWAYCSGQLVAISQFNALFALLGTAFGGDGRTSFGFPDLRGRVPVGSSYMGTGPGLTPYPLGTRYGYETVTLTVAQMPQHNHAIDASGAKVDVTFAANSGQADTHTPAAGSSLAAPYDSNNLAEVAGYNSTAPNVALAGVTAAFGGNLATALNGGSQAHENRQPLEALNACMCTDGLFPSRN